MLGDRLAGQHPLVTRFMKGIFNKRPCFPKTSVTWDTSLVLNYLQNLTTSNLKNLTLKAVMLTALLTGQRTQTVHLLSIQNMTVTAEFYKFRIGDIVKQTRPGNHLSEIELPAYPHDRRLCIVSILNDYLSKTKDVRGKTTQLFLSYTRPFKAVSKSTIARWVKTVLHDSGVDTSIFTPHSTRAASTSQAHKSRVPLHPIMKTAGWTQDSTFAVYYKKPVHTTGEFALALLNEV